MVGHVSPEAARGGPLAVVRDGDTITIDIDARTLSLEVADEELEVRLADWGPPELTAARAACSRATARSWAQLRGRRARLRRA